MDATSWQLLSVTAEEGADDGKETEKADEAGSAVSGRAKDENEEAEKKDDQEGGRTQTGCEKEKSRGEEDEEIGRSSRVFFDTREVHGQSKAAEVNRQTRASTPA
jgi:hypothetical protein